jgi:hypothetical protein
MDVEPGDGPPAGARRPRVAAHRRYWGYIDRPYRGLGCLWSVLFFLLLWLLLSMVFPPGVIWRPAWV